jgi:hypothetical protein
LAADALRRCLRRAPAVAAIALAVASPARAQFAGTLALASENRYRGSATEDVGPVLRASVLGDTAVGAYGGVSGLWRTRDGVLSSAETMLGWSGRLNAIGALGELDPAWGWDLGWHRVYYGDAPYADFSETMAGLLAPGWSARAWWSPHYYGSPWASVYAELNASRDFGEHWRAFAHVGTLRYARSGGWRAPGRTDAMVGAAWVSDAWELRLARDGLLSGQVYGGFTSTRHRNGWVLSASVAF